MILMNYEAVPICPCKTPVASTLPLHHNTTVVTQYQMYTAYAGQHRSKLGNGPAGMLFLGYDNRSRVTGLEL